MSSVEKINVLLFNIVSLGIFEDTSYYTIHLPYPLHRIFNIAILRSHDLPFYLQRLCIETKILIERSGLSQKQIIHFLASSEEEYSYFFICNLLLKKCANIELNDIQIDNILLKNEDFPEGLYIDNNALSFAVTSYTLDTNRYRNWDIQYIGSHERYSYDVSDYKLTKMNNVRFHQLGFVFDGKYYCYSRFISRRTITANGNMPALFEIFTDNYNLDTTDFYLRLDDRLAIPIEYADIMQIEIAEYYRGITFDFSNTKLNNTKEFIERICPQTSNRLLMIIKVDRDDTGEDFWHIELEELPFIDDAYQKPYVQTVFFHGQYYFRKRYFCHLDYAINQYVLKEYCEKRNNRLEHGIPIDYHTTKECHYKLWCLENTHISEEIWCHLIKVSLNSEYAQLFDEIISQAFSV